MHLRFSIRSKLILAFVVITSLVGLISYVSIGATEKVRNEYQAILGVQVPSIDALETVRSLVMEVRAETLMYQEWLQAGHSLQESIPQRNHILANLDKLTEAEDDYILAEAHESGESAVEETAAQRQLTTSRQEMVASVVELIGLHEKGLKGKAIDDKQAEVATKQEALTVVANDILEEEFGRIGDTDKLARQVTQRTIRDLTILSSLAMLFAILIGLFISSVIARRIRKLEEGMTHISAGDFRHTVTIKSKDELGHLAESFNQMSERLQNSYQRLAYGKQRDEALIESMSEGLIAVDEAGRVMLLNKVATTLFELSDPKTVIDTPLDTLAHISTEDAKPMAKEQHPAYITLTTGKASSGVFAFTSSTKKVLLYISSNPIVLDNKVTGAIVIIRDVTKEKEIDRMKTEFISLASHQLRTPLSAIKWFAEMLVNGDAGQLQDEQLDFAKNIAESTERMIDLVNSLLNISRIESGRIIVDPKPTDLEQLVNGIITDLKAKTAKKEQTLIVSVHKELGKINLDPHLIGQVYLNFLTNAIKYTPKGGEISVFISRKGDEVVSQITDNGYGIPKAQQERVFQKFFRAENVAKVETDGTGLGLYLVKAIIESSGGKVWFESQEGKGTTFWFSLPMSGMQAKAGEVSLDV